MFIAFIIAYRSIIMFIFSILAEHIFHKYFSSISNTFLEHIMQVPIKRAADNDLTINPKCIFKCQQLFDHKL